MKNFILAICISSILMLSSCSSADHNATGTEYMPDMFHSIAYEANLDDYYYYNTWGTESEYVKMAQPRKPVAGTIARGYAAPTATKYVDGSASTNAIAVPVNGSVPYYYNDTEEERTRAMNEIIKNPFPITAAGLKSGEELYNTFCAICHGVKGDGNGWLVDEANAKAVYPAAPANFLSETFTAVGNTNGRYYHSIMYGKNVMGGYADKISYEERWNVIHWIRSLQAKASEKEYNENINTLNSVDMTAANFTQMTSRMSTSADGHHDGAMHHGDGVHHSDAMHGEMHHEGAVHHSGDAGHDAMHSGSMEGKEMMNEEGVEKKKKGLKNVIQKVKKGVQKIGNKKKDKH